MPLRDQRIEKFGKCSRDCRTIEGIQPGRDRAVSATEEHYHRYRADDKQICKFRKKENSEFDATIFSIIAANELTLRFGQVEGNAINLSAGTGNVYTKEGN